jgi:chromosome segregation ATPase
MSDIFRDFDKKNEVPKIKIPKFATGVICNDAIPKLDAFSHIDEIVKDITKKKDNAMAMEFTKCIGELLRKNGVVPKISEYRMENHAENHAKNKIEMLYGVSIDELDFSEHDKVFEDKIAELEKRIQELDTIDAIRIDEKKELKQRIAELESMETETCEKEPIFDDCKQSMEWYENRHQSDCIEINRLNTTIDVLIHKVEYLRQFAGLE